MVAPLPKMTPAEYLVWERAQPTKHEYFRGEVFAMAGASPRHNWLGSRLNFALVQRLSTRGCYVFTSDQRVGLQRGERYVYPDVSVVCGSPIVEADDVIINPTIIVEVLSLSTEQNDRGSKWMDYQAIASLTDYVLVPQWTPRIEHFVRKDNGWIYRAAGTGEGIALANGTQLAVDEIFEGAMALGGDDLIAP